MTLTSCGLFIPRNSKHKGFVTLYGDKDAPKFVYSHRGKRKYRRLNLEYYITKEQYHQLRIEKKTQKEIGELTGLGQRMLSKMVLRSGWSDRKKMIPPKNNVINESFFKEWTRDSAWVYGWLLTDGYVSEDTGHIVIGLKREDRDVLEKIKRTLSFSGNIYDSNYADGRRRSTLRICRKEMAEDIFKLGLARKDKTFNTELPDVPDRVYWDLIRGIFEGDGSIRHRTGNTDALDITIAGATRQFIVDLQTSLEKRGIFMRMYTRGPGVSGSKHEMYTLNTKANSDALRLCYFMYATTNENTRLNRKFNIFKSYVSNYYGKIKRRSVPCTELVELSRQSMECNEDRCVPFLIPKRISA